MHLQYREVGIWKACILPNHGNVDLSISWHTEINFWQQIERKIDSEFENRLLNPPAHATCHIFQPLKSIHLMQARQLYCHYRKHCIRMLKTWMMSHACTFKLKINIIIKNWANQTHPRRFSTFKIASWAFWS